MALEQIGFQAVIQGLGTFLSGTAQMEKAQGRVEDSTKKTSSAFGAFQKIAMASAAAGVAAVLGLGVASLKMAADFDKGMREVNSIAKLSESGFKQLEKDTLAFSKQIGIAANEVVPALYQALSAGVPVDNVFEFMRIAGEAAIGGVTTLETAVDGLTSVVNAYGAENLSAARAADIMFKAVEVGKTTFEELSMNLADVVPTAVAAGVSFEEVAAAVATMTVQGIRTTIATTSLNQALVELQKPMPPLAKVMEMAAKKIGAADGSFKSMKLSGASLETILIALEDAAAEMGLSLTQVFGSVEASKAVLSLTGQSAEIAAKQFDQVTNSTGSARAAFEELNKSAARQYEMFKTKITATMIELGTRAIPLVIAGLEKLNAIFPTLVSGGTKLASALASIAKFAADNKVQVGLFIGILAVPRILGAASALLQVAGAMRGIAAARIGQAAADYSFFAKNLAGAPMLTRTLGPLVMTLGSLAGPLALGGVAIAAVAATIGLEKFLPFLSKGESAAERFEKRLQKMNDRLADIARSLALGKIDSYTASIYDVGTVMQDVTELGKDYVKTLEDIAEKTLTASRQRGVDPTERRAQGAREAAAANDAYVESMAKILRQADLTEPEVKALSNATAQAAANTHVAVGETNASVEANGLLLRAVEKAYPATAKQAGVTKEATQAAVDSFNALKTQAELFADIAEEAGAAALSVKGYDDVTKAVATALTKEQLVADAEIASLQRRAKELKLAGQAESVEAKNIQARITYLEDERELVSLTAAELVAKGRVQEALNKATEGKLTLDRDVLAQLLDIVEATGQDVSAERDALGIYPVVTQAMLDQAEAARIVAEKVAAIGPAAETSAGQTEAALQGPQQEVQRLEDLLRNEGLAAITAGGQTDLAFGTTAVRGIVGALTKTGLLPAAFLKTADAAELAAKRIETAWIQRVAAAIEAANRALSVLGMRLPVPSAAAPEGRQFGGPVAAGRPMWVGETQPEIWIPRSPGIVARPQQLQLGGAGLGSTYAPAFNVHGSTMEEMRAAFHRSIEDFFRRASTGAVGAGNSIYSGIG